MTHLHLSVRMGACQGGQLRHLLAFAHEPFFFWQQIG